ncbi:MAG: hypothetical protein AAF962_16140 [Actinomycetota bacterium]
MSDITVYDPVPLDVAAPKAVRPRLLLLATGLACSAVVMGYSGLLGYYIAARQAVVQTGEVWLPDGVVIPLTQPNFMALTLVFSVVSMLWALSAVRSEDKANAYIAFTLTLVFGFSQIVQTFYLLTIMEMPAAESMVAVLIFSLVGIQVALTGAGMGFVVVAMLRTLGGGYSARDYEGVLAATVFWIMTVGVYLALWYTVYITK